MYCAGLLSEPLVRIQQLRFLADITDIVLPLRHTIIVIMQVTPPGINKEMTLRSRIGHEPICVVGLKAEQNV